MPVRPYILAFKGTMLCDILCSISNILLKALWLSWADRKSVPYCRGITFGNSDISWTACASNWRNKITWSEGLNNYHFTPTYERGCQNNNWDINFDQNHHLNVHEYFNRQNNNQRPRTSNDIQCGGWWYHSEAMYKQTCYWYSDNLSQTRYQSPRWKYQGLG